MKSFKWFFVIIGLLVIPDLCAQIVTVPNVFSDNMVLQQNTSVPVWGWAKAGTSVTVSGSWGQAVTSVADSAGKWTAKLMTPVAISGQAPAYTLTIAGPANTIIFTNVLVGEVWMCSGQSNMWFPMNQGTYKVADYETEIAAANYPNIRLFTVPVVADSILAKSTSPATNCNSSWLACNPANVTSFSAIGYYFARQLYKNTVVNVPIGIISNAYWGSSIQAWMRDSVLRADATLKTKYLDKDYSSAATYAKPTLIYNAMVAPVKSYAIKGILWYQGEANAGDAPTYSKAIVALLKDLRSLWGRNLSFYSVQLAPLLSIGVTKDLEAHRAYFREGQSVIANDAKAGIVPTCDLLINAAEVYVLHPRDKKDIAIRLSSLALNKDYSVSGQYIGPVYQSFTIEGNKIRIAYKDGTTGSGLKSKDGAALKCFRIAGSDKLFYPAVATIDGNTIVLSSSYVANPIAARFAFTDGAMTNLINNEGFAAYPFRTDSWVEWPYPYFTPNADVAEINTNTKETLYPEFKTVYPNPVKNHVYVPNVIGDFSIQILDMSGKVLMSKNGLSDSRLDVSSLSHGVYVLKVGTSRVNEMYKFIK